MVTVGKLTNIYESVSSTLDGKNLEEKMLAIGSAVNSLGQASTANEGYMVEFMKRLGGIASQAKLSADQVLGYASALDQNGQAVEMSATAFMKLIQQMVKKPEEFVQAAGVSMEEFKRMMDADMNGAIMRVLEGMEKGGGFQQLIGMFADMGLDGARAATVVSSLAKHLDQVREAQALANQEMQTGNSVINEFNTKNDTLQAQAEKAKKKFEEMRIELGNELYPVLISLQRSGTVLMKGFAGTIQLFKEYPALIAPVIAGLIAMNRYRLMNFFTSGKLKKAIKTLIGVKKVEAAANALNERSEAKLAAKKEQSRLQFLKNQLAVEKENLARQQSSKQTIIQAQAIKTAHRVRSLEIQVTEQATAAEAAHAAQVRATRAAVMSVPWGMIIAALGSVFVIYKKIKENSVDFKIDKTLTEAAKAAGEAEGKLFVLKQRMEAAGKGTDTYRKALEELKAEYPEIIAKHIDEEGNLRDLEKAYKDLSAAARQSVYDRMYTESVGAKKGELAEELQDTIDSMGRYVDNIAKELGRKGYKKLSEAERAELKQTINAILVEVSEGGEGIVNAYQRINDAIRDASGAQSFQMGFVRSLNDLEKKAKETEEYINGLRVKMNPGNEDDKATYSALENAKKRKEAYEEEANVLRKRMELLSKRINNGYEGGQQYEAMKSQLYDLEAAARGAAYEIEGIEKTLSSLSVSQMKTRQSAIRQEILSLQSKLHVMKSMAFVDFTTKKQLEDDQAKIEQLNREWLQLEQAIKQAEETAKKATTNTHSYTTPKETEKERKAREKQEASEAKRIADAWAKAQKDAEKMTDKFNLKAESGLQKVKDEVDTKTEEMIARLRQTAGEAGESSEALEENLKDAAEKYKESQVQEYLAKVTAEVDKLKKATAKSEGGERLNKVSQAAENLRQQLEKINSEIAKLKTDLSIEIEGSDTYNQLEAKIKELEAIKKAAVSATFNALDFKVENPFEEQTPFSFAANQARALDEVNKKIEKYAKDLADAHAAYTKIAETARAAGDEDSAKEYEEKANALKEQADNIDEVSEKAQKLAKNNALKETINTWCDEIQKFTDQALSIFSNINSLLDNIADSELQKMERQKDAAIENLDEQLEQGVISQQEYEEQKKTIEDDYDDKEKETKLAQWKRQKALDLTQAVIAGALAAVRAYAEGGPYAGPILAAMVAAATGIQIAAIENQPEPYAKGGYVPRRTVYQAGEAGPEWVASNSLLSDPATAPIIEQLEAYQRGNRRALADIPMAQLNMPVAARAAQELGRRRSLAESSVASAVGSISPNVSVQMPDNREMMQLWRELATYLKDPRNRQAVISRQTMTDFESNENFLRNRARL